MANTNSGNCQEAGCAPVLYYSDSTKLADELLKKNRITV